MINKKSKKEIYLNIIFIIALVVFIAFNVSSTISYFDIDKKTEILDLGPYNYERVLYGFSFLERDQNGRYFRWSEDDSSLMVRVRGEIMFIPVFNARPDIDINPVNIKVYLNSELIAEHRQSQNGLFMIMVNLEKMEIVRNEYIILHFLSDTTWTPKEYGISEDTREISFALGEISFEN